MPPIKPTNKLSEDYADHVNTSSHFVPRYAGPPEEEMTAEQKEIRDAIVKSRPRTGLSGPFGPWLAVPGIAQPAQALGRACRYGTSLSFKESELVILLTGAKTRSHAEFDIHVEEALKAGWSLAVINAIPRDGAFSLEAVKEKVLPLLENDREQAIAAFTAELLDNYGVSDRTYESTKQACGGKDSVLVEITSISGYYTYVSYTLNVFRIPSK
jgi:4-carboxymuconolactone decarboxylase